LLIAASDVELEAQVAASDAWIASHPSSADPYIRTHWLFVLCVLGRYDLAFAQSEALGERLFRIVPFVHVADHTLHRGLAAAELALHAGGRSRRRYVRALRESLRRMRRWADSGPDFVHMQTVLEAELARLSSRFEAARKLYQRAVVRAREQRFPNHAALIQERHARLLLALRRDSEAELALREAAALYHEWGALPKVDALVRELNRTE
jgi:tetratricopeptide (TPR) repeat protein